MEKPCTWTNTPAPPAPQPLLKLEAEAERLEAAVMYLKGLAQRFEGVQERMTGASPQNNLGNVAVQTGSDACSRIAASISDMNAITERMSDSLGRF